MVGIAVVFALGCVGMGMVNGLIALFAGFLVLRAMGPGALSLVSLHAVNIWFVRRSSPPRFAVAIGLSAAALKENSLLAQ